MKATNVAGQTSTKPPEPAKQPRIPARKYKLPQCNISLRELLANYQSVSTWVGKDVQTGIIPSRHSI